MPNNLFKLRTLKKLMAGILTIFLCMSKIPVAVLANNTLPDYTDTGIRIVKDNEVELVEQLINEKYILYSELLSTEDENKKNDLQKRYTIICQKLQKLGVSEELLEDIPLINNPEFAPYATLPSFEALDQLFKFDTFYQYGYVGSTVYKFYNVLVHDKNGSKLHSTKNDSIVLCGSLSNVNQVKQLGLETIKFIASAGITAAIKSTWIGFALTTLISSIPNYEPEYLIHGGNTVTANNITIDEAVRYIYGYNEKTDEWQLIFSGNFVSIAYVTILNYKDPPGSFQTKQETEQTTTVLELEAWDITVDELTQYLIMVKDSPNVYHGMDRIYNKFDLLLNEKYNFTYTFLLHGTKEPYQLP